MIHHALTFSRLFSGPIVFYVLYKKDFLLALYLIVYAVLSDFLDGYFARLLNKQSQFGAVLDVIADKSFLYCSVSGVALLFPESGFILRILYIWIIRDAILLLLYYSNSNDFRSLLVGKIYTSLQFIFMLLVCLHIYYHNILNNLDLAIVKVLIAFFLLIGIYSMLEYYNLFTKNSE